MQPDYALAQEAQTQGAESTISREDIRQTLIELLNESENTRNQNTRNQNTQNRQPLLEVAPSSAMAMTDGIAAFTAFATFASRITHQ